MLKKTCLRVAWREITNGTPAVTVENETGATKLTMFCAVAAVAKAARGANIAENFMIIVRTKAKRDRGQL